MKFVSFITAGALALLLSVQCHAAETRSNQMAETFSKSDAKEAFSFQKGASRQLRPSPKDAERKERYELRQKQREALKKKSREEREKQREARKQRHQDQAQDGQENGDHAALERKKRREARQAQRDDAVQERRALRRKRADERNGADQDSSPATACQRAGNCVASPSRAHRPAQSFSGINP